MTKNMKQKPNFFKSKTKKNYHTLNKQLQPNDFIYLNKSLTPFKSHDNNENAQKDITSKKAKCQIIRFPYVKIQFKDKKNHLNQLRELAEIVKLPFDVHLNWIIDYFTQTKDYILFKIHNELESIEYRVKKLDINSYLNHQYPNLIYCKKTDLKFKVTKNEAGQWVSTYKKLLQTTKQFKKLLAYNKKPKPNVHTKSFTKPFSHAMNKPYHTKKPIHNHNLNIKKPKKQINYNFDTKQTLSLSDKERMFK